MLDARGTVSAVEFAPPSCIEAGAYQRQLPVVSVSQPCSCNRLI